MQGTYITKTAQCVEVLEFDAVNNMAYVDFGEGDKHWVGKPEYDEWAKPLYVPDTPMQFISQPKIEEDAIQIGEPEKISLDETPENSGEVGEGISEPEEPTQESENTSEEEVKPKRKYSKKVK